MENLTASTQTSETLHIASECAVCGKTLDFEAKHESVSWGIGPDCRKRHGFDKADAGADWGKALGYLGADCPAYIYDAVVAAHGCRQGFGPDDETGIDTTKKDVRAAIIALTKAIALAPQERATKAQVASYVLAISALGHHKLAFALTRSFLKRPQFRHLYPLVIALVTVIDVNPATKLVSVEIKNSYDFRLMGVIRQLGFNEWDRIKKIRTVRNVTPKAVFDALKAGGADLIAGSKGVSLGHALPESKRPAYTCWTDPCREEDRTWWLNVETGEERIVLAGEPTHRPGWERVPPQYFDRGTGSAVSA
jgi:hypothetical protein